MKGRDYDMDTVFEFENGVSINTTSINKIAKDFFEVVKKELPKEALTYECIDFILAEIKTQMKSKKIKL